MSDYLIWLSIHVCSVAVSLGLFVYRGMRAICSTPVGRRTWLGVVPHAVDTLLLVSAVRLTFLIQQFPFSNGWLTAKVVALLGYVLLGHIALQGSGSKAKRGSAFAAALMTAAYIVRTAWRHNPFPF